MSNTVIPLDYPIDINGAKVATLSFRRPKVADILAAKKLKLDDAESELRILANLAEVSPDDFAKLDLADYAIIAEQPVELAGFRRDGLNGKWIVDRVEHRFDKSGAVTSLNGRQTA